MPSKAIGLLAAVLVVGCGGGSSPPPPPPAYTDPRAIPAACPAVVLRDGGTSPVPDPAGTCVRQVGVSGLAPVGPSVGWGWIDLGVHTVGDVVPFVVPAGTASITLVEQEVGSFLDVVSVTFSSTPVTVPNAAVPALLTDPGGTVIYSDFVAPPDDGALSLLVQESLNAQAGTLSYPNTSAALARVGTAGVAPGTWHVTVSDYAYECWLLGHQVPPPLAGVTCDLASQRSDGRYRLIVMTRPGSVVSGAAHAIPDSGSVDVAIHIVDAPTPIIQVTAAAAPTDPAMIRLASAYAGFLANAGICLGTVTFYDAPGWARSRFGAGVSTQDDSPCGDIAQLLATSVPGSLTLDLFLVTRFTDPATSRGTVVGVDGAVPGPATVDGTVVSGVVVSAEDLGAGTCQPSLDLTRCGVDRVAYVAAHESGHYLGLYHPTESSGASFDPLSDTPRCECTGCGFTASQCDPTTGSGVGGPKCRQQKPTCSGGQNLMFWLFDPSTSVGFLSPEQGRVTRASPLVRSP